MFIVIKLSVTKPLESKDIIPVLLSYNIGDTLLSAALTSALLVILASPTTTLVVVLLTETFTLSELTVTLGSVTLTVIFAKAI